MFAAAWLALATSWLGASPTVCLDPGHSLGAPGAVVGGVLEEDLNWEVCEGLVSELTARGYRVISTRPVRSAAPSNKRRAEIANASGADLFLRIHANSASPSAHGFETFYPTRAGTDPDDGTTGPSADVIARTARLVGPFHRGVSRTLSAHLRDRGAKSDHLTFVGSQIGSLRGSIHSQVPPITFEMGFMSHPGDLAFLRSERGRAILVQAIADGVDAALGDDQAPR